MFELLAKKFVANREQTSDPAVRSAYGKLSSILGIICNVILFIGKIIVGSISGSVSISADALNNLTDASSSVISLFGFKLAEKPADKDHPYGHGRYEYLSALTVAVLIMVIGVELFKSSLDKILNPSQVDFSIWTVVVLAASIGVKFWMMLYNKKAGKLIASDALFATASDCRNDVISTAVVLIASIISHFAGFELDGWMGMAVAVFILVSGFQLVRDTLDPLLGKAPDPALVSSIKETILSYEGVAGTHDLIVHDYGPSRVFASVHVEMSSDDDVFRCHDIIDNIEKDFEERGLHLIIHYDPIDTRSTELGEFRKWLSENILRINSELTIHDLRIVPGVTHTNVIFDCVAPHGLELSDNQLRSEISELVKEYNEKYICVITIDKNYAPII